MILYLLSKDNLAIKAVQTLSSYEFKEDIDFGDSSSIVVADYLQMEDGDYALIKDGEEQVFFGICQEMKPSDTGYSVTLKQKENLFDTTIFNDGETLIQSTGMEDYIVKAIKDNFVSSGDALMDMDYIQVSASTHTKIAVRVSTIVDAENGVYNLKTFLGNVRQHYGIFLDFTVSNGLIRINVNCRDQSLLNIDTKLPEVTDLSETYSVKVLAKLIVKWDKPKEAVTTDMVTTRTDVTEPGYVADAQSVSDTYKMLKSTLGLFGNHGVLVLNSESADPASVEGSQIALWGRGGNTGQMLNIDGNNNIIRFWGNFGTENVHVYGFAMDGIYLDGRKITN